MSGIRGSPWRHAKILVPGYHGVSLESRLKEKKLQNLFRMLNENVVLRKSFMSHLQSFIHSKTGSDKVTFGGSFVSENDAQQYQSKEFQQNRRSGQEMSIANTFLLSTILKEEIKHMLKFDVLENSQPIYHCKNCKEFAYGKVCYKSGSHKIRIIPTYKLSEFTFNIWSDSPGKFLEGMCYSSLINTNKIIVEPSWSYKKVGDDVSTTQGEIDVMIRVNNNMKVNLPENFRNFCDNQIAILATTSISPNEKNQIDKLFGLKVPCIFVTTDRFDSKGKCLKVFEKVKDDKNFPRNLVEFMDTIIVPTNDIRKSCT